MTSPRRVSQSELGTYFRCGEQWRRAYVERNRCPPGIALIKGRVGHKVAEHNFRHKAMHLIDAPIDELLDVAQTSLRSEIAGGVAFDEQESAVGAKATITRATDRVYAVTRVFRETVAPPIIPELIEEKIEAPMTIPDMKDHTLTIWPAKEVTIVGIIDLSDRVQIVHDFKISGRIWKETDAHQSDQFSFYDYLFEAHTGQKPRALQLDVIRDSGKSIKYQQIRTQRDGTDRGVLMSRIRAFLKGVEAGVALPAMLGTWVCTPKFCGYWATCPYVNAERIEAAQAQGI